MSFCPRRASRADVGMSRNSSLQTPTRVPVVNSMNARHPDIQTPLNMHNALIGYTCSLHTESGASEVRA